MSDGSLHLPNYSEVATPNFSWGILDPNSMCDLLGTIFMDVVHWKPNLFKIPSGSVGKSFVSNIAKLYNAFGTASAMECIALKTVSVMPCLLLQKSHSNRKGKEAKDILERRLALWRDGNLQDLFSKGRAIQCRLSKPRRTHETSKANSLSRTFANMMFQGKVGAALQLLSDKGPGSVLGLHEVNQNEKTVKQILIEKHPPRMPVDIDSITHEKPLSQFHPVIYDQLDANSIRKAALKTKGAAGPSGLDAYCWRRLCTYYK